MAFIIFIVYCILMDIWHKYAYKRCIRHHRCREWMCKYYHECEYANERDQE